MKKQISKNEKETYKIAKKISKTLKGGEIIGLTGDLGAGKTTFTKGLAKALDIKDNVNSPTFVIMNIYNINIPKSKIKKLCHIDAYRIETNNDLLAIGAQEYFERKDTITIIEWADKIKKILPAKTKYINFIQNNKERIIVY